MADHWTIILRGGPADGTIIAAPDIGYCHEVAWLVPDRDFWNVDENTPVRPPKIMRLIYTWDRISVPDRLAWASYARQN
jgi:hypothetical protein